MALKGRGPVEHLNRQRKARMIEAFLFDALGKEIRSFGILDIGCGNGQISQYFSRHNYVQGVDVEDKRNEGDSSFDFSLIADERLPFDDACFDIVISHHVIEHVQDQNKHLSEMKRVLRPKGIAYLGCPNKSSPFMAGHVGNDSVPNWREAVELFEEAQFDWEDYYARLLAEPAKYHCETELGKYLPLSLIKLLKPWYPGHCFILRRS